MIEDFVKVHKKNPNRPVSGNRMRFHYVDCHCGCASLTKKEYFGKYFQYLDADLMSHCASEDMFYTYLINKNGNRYIHTKDIYYVNLPSYNPSAPYSDTPFAEDAVSKTWHYLVSRYGRIRGYNEALRIARMVSEKVRTCFHF